MLLHLWGLILLPTSLKFRRFLGPPPALDSLGAKRRPQKQKKNPPTTRIHESPLVISVIHMRYIRSIWWQYLFDFVFFGIVTLKCRSVATSIQTPYHPRANERSNPQQNTSDPWSFENGFWCNYVCIFQKVTLIKVLQCDVAAYHCVKAIALSSMCNLRKRIRATYPFLCTRFSVKYTLFLQILHCFSCKFCSFSVLTTCTFLYEIPLSPMTYKVAKLGFQSIDIL